MPQAQQTESFQPKRLPLVLDPENRDDDATKDARLINGYMEKSRATGEYSLYKRFGLSSFQTQTGNGYGAYNWKGDVYTVFGTTLYKNGVSIGTVDGTGGVYRFDSTMGATSYLVLGNGVKAYTYDGATLLQITDVDFPSAFIKGWAYLDGTSYVGVAAGQIYGSAINNPTSWDPLNFLTAQIEPDQAVAIAKQLVYVIDFKQWSTEFFYDALNATGSPLGPSQGNKLNYGCASANSVASIDGMLFWATTNREASPQVAMMDALSMKVISTPPIDRLLLGADFSAVYSWTIKYEGHRFYVLTLKNDNLTLAYDATEKLWSQWTDVNGNYLPIVASTFDSSNRHILQHESNGKLYYADRSYTNDDGSLITVDLYTPNFDAGVRRLRKHLPWMEFVADQTPGSFLDVRCNDSDYDSTKWTNFRRVDLSVKRPYLDNCGTFYRRAYHFRHRCNTRLRIQAAEMSLSLGTL